MFKRREGFSVIELLLVIAVIAVLVQVLTPSIARLLMVMRVPGVVRDLTVVTNRVQLMAHQDRFNSTPYSSLFGSAWLANNVFAKTSINHVSVLTVSFSEGTGFVQHPLALTSKAVQVDIAQILQYGDSFSVTLAEVNDAACSDLVVQMARQVVLASINGVTVKPVNGNLNLALTHTTCQEGDVNSIVFVFQ